MTYPKMNKDKYLKPFFRIMISNRSRNNHFRDVRSEDFSENLGLYYTKNLHEIKAFKEQKSIRGSNTTNSSNN